MKLLIKNTFRKIKKSLGRFLSIMLIIMLGISIFIGLRESTAGMLYTADNYYDKYNLMDFKIISTYGLNDDDVNALSELEDSLLVIPSYSVDLLINGDAVRIHAIENTINNVSLVKGRMPENDNECVADYSKYSIGENITFNSDMLSISSCEVVGTIKSVLYVREEKGISSVGNGKLDSFIFINKSNFVSDYYTEIYITAKGSLSANSYYDDYEKSIQKLKKELEELKPIRETIRYEEILTTATDEIIKIKNELNNNIENAMTDLNNIKYKLDTATEEFNNKKEELEEEYETNSKALNDSKNIIISNLSAIGLTEEELDNYINNLYNEIKDLNNQLTSVNEKSDEYVILNNELVNLETDYNNLTYMQSSLNEINGNLDTLNDSYSSFISEMSEEQKQIDDGYNEYYLALENLETEKETANNKISEEESKLDEIEKPTWYLLDRTSNNGYLNYKEDIIKVDSIAKILPIFFVMVVILMILNTLTRLIEEERTEIGIFLSNGFSKNNIIFNYVLYVLLSGIFGIILGLTVGYSLIPKIIYGVFLSRYYVPKLITVVSPLPFSLVISITILIILSVTIFACKKSLKETPANLLRPKSPKSGKKIFIEKNRIWNKLDFMWKITIRNLFRYKKRIIMTILGVGGCTALLLAGLGINDSINNISKLQYEYIIKYDASYILDGEISTIPNDLKEIFNDNGIVNPLLLRQDSFTYVYDNKTSDVYMMVPYDINNFSNYVKLNSIINNKLVTIPEDGAIITEQMANNLNVTVGDSIKIRNDKNELYVIYVKDIVENYVSHYIYMSKEYYEEVFNKDIKYNTVIANGQIDENIKLTDYNVLVVNYTSDILKTFDSFVSGLNQIIILIVVLAAFLAIIVLYNLTIINVSERKREIATFKVLGFNDKEISAFVFRETIILTVLGIILGLILGIFLHRYIILTAETDNIMFIKTIKPLSYIVSAIITITFSYIVQMIINKTLKKINMIDSLKSVE